VEVIRVEDERVLVGAGLESGEWIVASAAVALAGSRIDPVLADAHGLRLSASEGSRP
jgi:hypothetical protein